MIHLLLQYLGIGLILTAVVNAFIQLYSNFPLGCDKWPCRLPGPFEGSQDSLYENYSTLVGMFNIFCGAPSSLMFLISGVLCLNGPTLGIIICNTITSIFHLVILILAIIFSTYEDVYLSNCIVNFSASTVGMSLSATASVLSIVNILSTE